MVLNEERLQKNYEKYISTAHTYGFLTSSLTTFLDNEFKKAPASTSKSLTNAFDGGLIQHILTVTKYAVSVNNLLPEKLRVNNESLIKVCCLHQIGKAKIYEPNKSEWHRNNQGVMYTYKENIGSMRIGERSVYISLSNGVTLTEDEYSAIINHDKPDSDLQSKYYNSNIGDVLKTAISLAVIEERNY